jgi:hypothetical protein
MSEKHYETERLVQWRREKLNESFTKTLEIIAEYGFQVWSVFDNDQPEFGFSYTVGIFDTGDRPELLTVGLPPSTAHTALKKAAELLRSGANLTIGKHRDLVGKVDVKFLPVAPKWLHQVMLRTDWYYRGEDIPVFQLLYPDMENHFQDEENFDEYFRQPILAPGLEEGLLERGFWTATERKIK